MSRNTSLHEQGFLGLFLTPFKWLLGAVLLLALMLLTAWMVDWLMVAWVWPDGVRHLESILARDLTRAMEHADRQSGRPALVTGLVNWLYSVVFKLTGIHEMGARFAENSALSIPDSMVRNAYVAHYDKVRVAMMATQLLSVRLCLLLMLAPAFALAYAVAFVDGWTQRAIRRASGGRESASLYHRAKRLGYVVGALVVFACLLLPDGVDPRDVVVPASVVLVVLTRLQWTFYKKHL